MKYRVRKGATLLYPDGSVRGLGGYIVDGKAPHERTTVQEQADVLERCRDRQTPASPVDLMKLAASASPTVGAASSSSDEEPEKVTKKKAKKKAKKKGLLRRKKEDGA